jgi:hypothetical protein
MLPLKQAANKPLGQNLSGEGCESSSFCFAIAKTQVRENRLQTEMKEKSALPPFLLSTLELFPLPLLAHRG